MKRRSFEAACLVPSLFFFFFKSWITEIPHWFQKWSVASSLIHITTWLQRVASAACPSLLSFSLWGYLGPLLVDLFSSQLSLAGFFHLLTSFSYFSSYIHTCRYTVLHLAVAQKKKQKERRLRFSECSGLAVSPLPLGSVHRGSASSPCFFCSEILGFVHCLAILFSPFLSSYWGHLPVFSSSLVSA